jgi:hypothetical protein
MIVAVLLSLALQAAPEKESVVIPGVKQPLEMVRLPGGPGMRPFSIGTREVSWGEFNQYGEVKNRDGVTTPTVAKAYFGQVGVPADFMKDARPATNVRWHGALGYCEWLSKKTGRYFRLPTEREWEYAARAGDAGPAPAALDDVAWHEGNAGKQTHDVGGKKPNAFGLVDTLGNVWELCLETGTAQYLPVLRGGSWTVKPADLTFASRRTIPESWFSADCVRPQSVWWLGSNEAEQGFRVVCVADAADAGERQAASAKMPVKILKATDVEFKTGKMTEYCVRIEGEVTNGTGRAIDELEVRVCYLTPKGKPHLTDKDVPKPGRATFANGWPVLPSGADPAATAPLQPGEKRTFVLHLPQSFDTDEEVEYGKFGGAVMNLRYAKD